MALALPVDRSRHDESSLIHPFFKPASLSTKKSDLGLKSSNGAAASTEIRSERSRSDPKLSKSSTSDKETSQSEEESIHETGRDIVYKLDGQGACRKIKDEMIENLVEMQSNVAPHRQTEVFEMESSDRPREKRRKISSESSLPLRKTKGHAMQQQLLDTAFGLNSRAASPSLSQLKSSVHPQPTREKEQLGDSTVALQANHKQMSSSLDGAAKNSLPSDSVETKYIQPKAQASRPKTPPKKMLKVRKDGRLASPKAPKEDQVKPKRGRKHLAAITKESKVLVLRYGNDQKSASALGGKINCVLAGALRIAERSKADTPKPSSDSVLPPKKTHPFFLGPLKVEPIVDTKDSLDRQVTGPSPRKKRVGSASSVSRPWISTFNTNRPPRYPKAPAAPWPMRDMAHVRGLDQPFFELPVRPSKRLESSRKLKDSRIILSHGEEVLGEYKKAADSQQQYSHKPDIRKPTRKVLARENLRDTVSKRLSVGSPPGFIRHSCIQQYLDNISSSLSAFDKFECDSLDWTSKYAPKRVTEVLQDDHQVEVLRDWLLGLTVSSTTNNDTSNKERLRVKRKRKRRKASDLDSFIVSTDEEEYQDAARLSHDPDHSTTLTTTCLTPNNSPQQDKSLLRRLTYQSLRNVKGVVISGPHGCGKTAAVYAVAHDLGFEVFEINAGTRRSGRDVLDKVGDMARNHLVNRAASEDEVDASEDGDNRVQDEIESGRQSTMQAFFKPNVEKRSNGKKSGKEQKEPVPPTVPVPKKARQQKQSLILLEEVDVLFEEDKNFWSTVISLLESSRRPIIMTCTNETLLPASELEACSILRLSPPAPEIAADYLLLLAAHEGHLLFRTAIEKLYASTHNDLRSSIQQLQFWCQMAIGDEKAGLDWMFLRSSNKGSPPSHSEVLRVISDGTYLPLMGLLSRNEPEQNHNCLDQDVTLLGEAIRDWSYDVEDWTDWLCMLSDECLSNDPKSHYHKLCLNDTSYEAISAGDIMHGSRLLNHTALDTSQDPLTEKAELNYTTGYHLLQVGEVQDETAISRDIMLTLKLCARIVTLEAKQPLNRDLLYRKILSPKADLDTQKRSAIDRVASALEPLMPFQNEPGQSKANSILASENRASIIATDIAPYVRSIVDYDMWLEQERLRLSNLLSQGGIAGKKQRKTRASRAALEGGSKANTRRERWFTNELNFPLVLETAGEGWVEALRSVIKGENVDEMEMQYDSG